MMDEIKGKEHIVILFFMEEFDLKTTSHNTKKENTEDFIEKVVKIYDL